MKRLVVFLAGSMALSSGLFAAGEPAGTNAASPKKLSTNGGPQAIGKTLTDEEISSFKTESIDEKGKTKYQFGARFGAAAITDPKDKKKYAKSGEIPIRVTCALYEIKNADTPKPLMRRMSGNVQFYILDSDGKMLLRKTVSLDKMCPS